MMRCSTVSVLNSDRMVPEIRTTQRTAIALTAAVVFALVVSFTVGSQLEDPFKSETAAVVILGLWCLVGAGAAMTAIVDAYIKPEGELLGLITTIAATVFALLALVVVIGVIVGATGVVEEEIPGEQRSAALDYT
jgi:hypothetical protein